MSNPRDAVRTYPDGREVCQTRETAAGVREYRARKLRMAERQNGLCALCGTPMGSDITFDHERSRGMGGCFRDDRIEVDGKWQNGAVHYRCNSLKGSRNVPYVVMQ